MKIDLHTHTFYSDGSFSPKFVIDRAIKRNVKYLAITDHNVIKGLKEAVNYSKDKPIKFIPGIEFSARVSLCKDEIHLVGLYFNIDNKKLNDFSQEIIVNKLDKTKNRLNLLNQKLSTCITINDVKKKTLGVPGLPHIWMVLVDLGLAKDLKEAREIVNKNLESLKSDKDKNIHVKDAIELIHNAGGVAILAHLSAYKNENKFKTHKEQEDLVKELVSYGLDGIEIYIPNLSEEDKNFGETICKKYKLKASIGSDFHNEEFIPQNKIGFLDIDKEKITILRD